MKKKSIFTVTSIIPTVVLFAMAIPFLVPDTVDDSAITAQIAFAQTADTTPPVIMVNDTFVVMPLGFNAATTHYKHLGVSCTDDTDPSPTLVPHNTPRLDVHNSVHNIQYTCTDASGNAAVPKNVTLGISDTSNVLGGYGTGKNKFVSPDAIHTFDDKMYVSDDTRIQVYLEDSSHKVVERVAGISGIAANSTHVLFTDYSNSVIKSYEININMYDRDLVYASDFGSGIGMSNPTAIAIDHESGAIWVVQENGNLLKFDSDGSHIKTYSSTTIPAVNADGNAIAISGQRMYLTNGDIISVYAKSSMQHVLDIGTAGTNPGNTKNVIDVQVEGSLVYILNAHNATFGSGIIVYDTSGNYIAQFGHTGGSPGSALDNPKSMSVYGHMVFVVEGDMHAIHVISKSQIFEKSGGYEKYKAMQSILDNEPPKIIYHLDNEYVYIPNPYYETIRCHDAVDGYIQYNVSGTVGTSPGYYKLAYTCTDTAGNSAQPQTKRVFVIDPENRDDTYPVITIRGSDYVRIPYGTQYVDKGATCTDDVDGNLDVIAMPSDTGSSRYWEIKYACFDYSGNFAYEYRYIDVYDDVPPTVTLIGPSTVTLNVGDRYNDHGATCEDEFDETYLEINNQVRRYQPGTYTIMYTCYDYSNNFASVNRTVIIGSGITADAIQPTITIQSTGTTGTIATSFILNAVANDASGIASIVWYDNDTQIGTGTSITKSFGVGLHQITAVATDNSANQNQKTSNMITIVISAPIADTTPPTITIASNPSSGTTATSFTLTATANDASGIASVVWYDGTTQIGTGNAITKTFGAGTHNITAVATDGSTNSNTATSNTITLQITTPPPPADTTPPTISIVSSPLSGTTATSFTLTATANDASGIASVVWYDGTTQIGTGNAITKTFGAGTHNITAVATDGSTNSNTATSNTITLQITTPPPADTTPPTIAIASNPSSSITTATSVTFTATASDASGIASIVWHDNGTQIGTGATLTKTFSVAGNHRITATATDNNNNQATSSTLSLSVIRVVPIQTPDTTPPTISITATPPTGITTETLVYFNAGVSDDTGIDTVVWYDGTRSIASGLSFAMRLSAGMHNITAVATDNSTNANKATSNVLRLSVSAPPDTTAPTITIASNPSSGITTATSVTFTATANDASGIASITWYDDTTNIGTGTTITKTFGAGAHTITAVATDRSPAGNQKTSNSLSFTASIPDTTAPTITIASNPSSGITTATSVTFTATANDASGIASVVWYDGNTNIGTGTSITKTFGAGAHTITAVATDGSPAGNQKTSNSLSFTASIPDTTAPTITIASNPSSGITTATSVTFTATANDASGIASVVWYDGSTNIGTGTSITKTFGAGAHTITAVATDGSPAGNQKTSNSLSFTASIPDTTAPTITIASNPSSGITTATSVTFTATANDASGIASVVWYDGSTNIGTGTSITKTFGAGAHTITAVATDGSPAGNQKTSNSLSFTASIPDTTAPTITIASNPSSGITTATSVTLSATANDASGIASVVWYDGNTNIGTGTSITKTFGAGAHTITAVATDNNGNQATSDALILSVTRVAPARVPDTTPPTISITASPSAGITTATSVTLSATANDASGIASVVWYDGSTNIGTGTSITKTFGAGAHTITAVATDGSPAGNQKTSNSLSFTASIPDTTAPTITIASNPSSGITTATSVTLSATANDASGIASVVWYDGNTNIGTGTSITKTFGAGAHTITAVATDNNGNQATSDALILSVTRVAPARVPDTTPPTISITASPSAGITTATSVTLSATANDASGIASVVWYDGSTNIGTGTSITKTFGAGTHNITAVATDSSSAANQKTSNLILLAVSNPDTTPPSIIIAASPSAGITTATSVTLSATANDASGIASVVWYDGSTEIGTGTTITKTLGAGTHNITAVATDSSSAANQKTSNLILLAVSNPDTTPPSIIIAASPSAGITTATSVTLTATANDASGIDSITWYDNSTQIGTGTTITKTFAVGVHNITAVATDNSTNHNTARSNNQTFSVVLAPTLQEIPDTQAAQQSLLQQQPILPRITISGPNVVIIDRGATYNAAVIEQNVQCTSDITPTTNMSNNAGAQVNAREIGDYTVTFACTDDQGNAAPAQNRTAQVRDSTAPVITITGQDPLAIDRGSTYSSITARDGVQCIDESGTVTITNNADTQVNASEIGDYTVTFACTDDQGNAAPAQNRTVQVRDSTAPVITITGQDPLAIDRGSTYSSITARDGVQCIDESGTVTITNNADTQVNASEIGDYTVTFACTDDQGNAAPAQNRTVQVRDSTAPVITITGQDPLAIDRGSTYSSITARDGVQCIDESGTVTITNNADTQVNASRVGNYTVTYLCSDDQRNEAVNKTRTVKVVEPRPLQSALSSTEGESQRQQGLPSQGPPPSDSQPSQQQQPQPQQLNIQQSNIQGGQSGTSAEDHQSSKKRICR